MVSAAYSSFPAAPFLALAGLRPERAGVLAHAESPRGWNRDLPTDVVENAEELRFTIEVPGLGAADLEVTVEDGVLTVAAEKTSSSAGDAGTVRLAERRHGRFTRQFRLPRTVDAGRLVASCDNGLLTVRVPRSETARSRRIEVQAEAPAAEA